MANEAKSWPAGTFPPVGTWVRLMQTSSLVVFWYGGPVIGPFIGLDVNKRPCIACKQDPKPEMGWIMGSGSCMEAVPAEEVAMLQLATLERLGGL